MATLALDVQIYTSHDGQSPFPEWLDNLRDVAGRAVIKARIARLRLGNFGDFKTVGGGVFELRIDYGPGYRVYLGKKSGVLVILLCGGDKRSQQRDIKKAQELWDDYRSRDDDEE